MSEDIRSLLPEHKQDIKRAQAIVARGYPAIAPILPELVAWLQDGNWPVAHILAPLLAGIGVPLVPEIRRVLQTNNDIWKYCVLSRIVAQSSPAVTENLKEELRRIVSHPTQGEVLEDVRNMAQELLEKIQPRPSSSFTR